jgi:hypothetical protein
MKENGRGVQSFRKQFTINVLSPKTPIAILDNSREFKALQEAHHKADKAINSFTKLIAAKI